MWTLFILSGTISKFSCTRQSITVLPPDDDPNSRPQTLYLAHHRVESDGWRHQNGCTKCRSDYLEIIRLLTYYCIFPCISWRCSVCRRQPPSLAASAPILFPFTLNPELFELTANTSTISTCTPLGQIGLADENFSHPNIPSSASRMFQTGLIVDDIVTVLEVMGRGRKHVPTPSAHLAKRSLHWRTFVSNCCVNSFSNSFSFLPIVVCIGSLYSLGCVNIVTDVQGYQTYPDDGGW